MPTTFSTISTTVTGEQQNQPDNNTGTYQKRYDQYVANHSDIDIGRFKSQLKMFLNYYRNIDKALAAKEDIEAVELEQHLAFVERTVRLECISVNSLKALVSEIKNDDMKKVLRTRIDELNTTEQLLNALKNNDEYSFKQVMNDYIARNRNNPFTYSMHMLLNESGVRLYHKPAVGPGENPRGHHWFTLLGMARFIANPLGVALSGWQDGENAQNNMAFLGEDYEQWSSSDSADSEPELDSSDQGSTSSDEEQSFGFGDVLLKSEIAESAAPYTYRHFSQQEFDNMRSELSCLMDIDKALVKGLYPAEDKKQLMSVLEDMVRNPVVSPETIEIMINSLSSPMVQLVLAKRAAVLNTKYLLINLVKNYNNLNQQQDLKAMLKAIVEQHGSLSEEFPNVPTLSELLSESVLMNNQYEMSFIQYIRYCGASDLIPEFSKLGMPESNDNVVWVGQSKASADILSPIPPSVQAVSTSTTSCALTRPRRATDLASANKRQESGSRPSRARPRPRSMMMQNSHAMLASFNLQSASERRSGFRTLRARGNDEAARSSVVAMPQPSKRVTPPGGHRELMNAIRSGHVKQVEALCEKMTIADLNKADAQGETPIIAALSHNKPEIIAPLVKAFISERAAINVIKANGQSLFAENTHVPNSLAQRLLKAVTADLATYHCGDALTFQSMIPDTADKAAILSKKPLNRDSLGANSIQPGTGGFSRRQIKTAARLIDSSRSAVCTTFALSTADKLLYLFPNERVEIVAHNGGRGSHVYVMMNRKGNELDTFNFKPEYKPGTAEFTETSAKAINRLGVRMEKEMANAFIVDPWLGSIGYPSVFDLQNYLQSGLLNFILHRERHFDSRQNSNQLRQKP